MSKQISQFDRKSKKIKSAVLPHIDWQLSAPLSPAAARIAHRFRLAPATAELIALLAGLGQESVRHG